MQKNSSRFLTSKVKGGNQKFNLQQEIRGGMKEVASRRGFLAGISETNRKSFHPCVKSSSSPLLHRSGGTGPLLFTLLFNLSVPDKLHVKCACFIVYYELVSAESVG